MLARHATAVALLALVVLVTDCAGPTPEPVPAHATVPVAAELTQPTVPARPPAPAEPTPGWMTEMDALKTEIRAIARRVLNRDVQRVETAQQRDGRYTMGVAYVIGGTVTPSTSKASLAMMRDKADDEAAKLLRAILEAKPELAALELHGWAVLENPQASWQQDALRVSISAAAAEKLTWNGATPAAVLAGADTWWWLDVFLDVGAASEQQYAEKNAAYTKPRG